MGGEERGGYTNMDGGQQKRRGRGGKGAKKREGYSKRRGGIFTGYAYAQEMNRQAGTRANSSSR